MRKGEIVIDLYFGRYFIAYVVGRDKRHTVREKYGRRLDTLWLLLAAVAVATLLIGAQAYVVNTGLIRGVETRLR